MQETIHVRVSKHIKEALKKLSKEQGRTVSDLVKEAIICLIKKYMEGKDVMRNM